MTDTKWRIKKWFPDLNDTVYTKLKFFHSELLHFNKSINLISSKTAHLADDIHIADAILGARIIFSDTDAKEIYDIGSGNGIPGLVMALLEPDRKFILVDADGRKCEFLKLMAKRLEASNVTVISKPLSEIPEGAIRCAVSRGFANLSRTLVLSRLKMAVGGQYYNFKSESWFREVGDIPSQVLARFTPELLGEYSLPGSSAKLSIIKVIKK